MAPTIQLNTEKRSRDPSITVTWYSLDEAWETAEVIKYAGLRHGKIVDNGFYIDGVLIQDLVTEARNRQTMRKHEFSWRKYEDEA